ncbi:MAG: Arc family DNA binding domain-containing protein [Candidatus Omnitrophica bacterium]|nr:Arc family DNA binding domain-containing protein [Candidatus Omnitrophota bacterium]
MSLKKRFLLRINPDLWEEINRWADEELRSVNGQIEYLLKRAVAKRKREKSSEEREGEDMAP